MTTTTETTRQLPDAEDVRCWKSGTSSPDTWVDKTTKLISKHGGTLTAQMFGSEPGTGRAAYMVRFELEDTPIQVVWPVLHSREGNELAAKRQAATLMHHDVEARLVSAQVLGARTAFFCWLALPNGQSAYQLSDQDLIDHVPQMILEYKPK